MKFLAKIKDSIALKESYSYDKQSDRRKIREVLYNEQMGFCAYSEEYLKETDSKHIEHFDPRLKNTPKDNYWNWYLVTSWMNEHKPKKIEPYFLPILSPFSEDLDKRIIYEDGIFRAVNSTDNEAIKLIKFLKLNAPELDNARKNHIGRVLYLKGVFENDEEKLVNYLSKHIEELSYLTALEVELQIPLFEKLKTSIQNTK
jgi:uncharacterized protein (TIGR02646 family)